MVCENNLVKQQEEEEKEFQPRKESDRRYHSAQKNESVECVSEGTLPSHLGSEGREWGMGSAFRLARFSYCNFIIKVMVIQVVLGL